MKQEDWERLRVIHLLMVAAFVMLFIAVIAQGGLSLVDALVFFAFEALMLGFGIVMLRLRP